MDLNIWKIYGLFKKHKQVKGAKTQLKYTQFTQWEVTVKGFEVLLNKKQKKPSHNHLLTDQQH